MTKENFDRDPETYRLSSCVGKEVFDRPTANFIARKSKHAAVKAYQCGCCGHWHVGQAHKPKTPRARKPRRVN